VKIISGLFEPSEGKISYSLNSLKINNEYIFKHLGFVSPYLNLYDEFTALENLKIFDKIRNSKNSDKKYREVLSKTNLLERCNDYLRVYSSGMKQRLKYSLAILNHPVILILDEPTSNLDSEGMEMARNIMENQRKSGILILATNDCSDLKYCNYIIDLDKN
jgi:heme exporter protein A